VPPAAALDLQPLGDAALLARTGGGEGGAVRALALAEALDRAALIGVVAVVPAYATVAIHFEPRAIVTPRGESPMAIVARWIEEIAASDLVATARSPQTHALPTGYGGKLGPDLAFVAEQASLSPADVIERHAAASYRVAAVGFTPGFGYLAGLPRELATPRRATPRLVVAAGSVAIGGDHSGVYPLDSPGGWNVIGRTSVRLFDPSREPAALLAMGDHVHFEPVGARAFAKRARSVAEESPVPAVARVAASHATLEVIEAGLQTTVQDLGRPRLQAQGIAPGGAVDRFALRVANRLVGNDEGAAALEFALMGPRLRVMTATRVALTGAEIAGVPNGRPFAVEAGTLLDLRALTRGARGVLALAGGLDVPRVLGARATDLRAKFGGFEGRALQAGDRLATNPVAGRAGVVATLREPARASWFVDSSRAWFRPADEPLRLVRGPQADDFDDAAWSTLLSRPFTVTARSDRMGVRLAGPPLARRDASERQSEGVASGTLQVPPDGQPIVLLADRQTIGGYPKIANVVAVDLGRLAQRRPGDTVRFQEIGLAEAEALDREEARAWALLDAALRLRGST
jgi:KipI family sensor histidine kinase inhibitor